MGTDKERMRRKRKGKWGKREKMEGGKGRIKKEDNRDRKEMGGGGRDRRKGKKAEKEIVREEPEGWKERLKRMERRWEMKKREEKKNI